MSSWGGGMVHGLTLDLEDQMLMQDGGRAETVGKRVKRNTRWTRIAWGLAVLAALAGLCGTLGAPISAVLSLAGGWVSLRAGLQEVEILRVGF